MHFGRRSFLMSGAALAFTPFPSLAQTAPAPVGTVGALVNSQGLAGVVFRGKTSLSSSQPLTAAHRWHIGSNTKAMTGALYARLVDQRKLRWGATIPQLFPHLDTHLGWANTTIEEVMGHVAGISDLLIDSPWLLARHQDTRPAIKQRQEFAQSLLSQPPQPTAGSFSYGNAGYILIGAAIEHATGRSWEENMTSEIFRPLGMRSSGFGAPPADGPWGHRSTPGGVLPVDPRGLADNPVVLGPAGRVHSTSGDYAQFLAVFLNEGGNLLRKESFRRLLSPPLEDGTYAGGWALQKSAKKDMPNLVHEGSNTFWHAIAVVYRSQGIAVTAIANQAADGTRPHLMKLMQQLRTSAQD